MTGSVGTAYPKLINRPASWLFTTAVFGIGLAWFAVGVERVGLASSYADPVSQIPAQDDAVYAREAIEMAQGGTWLTPQYLGRHALNKPPLLQCLAAASVKLFGISNWALRVPSLFAAALVLALVFALTRYLYSVSVAAGAVLLLASSHLFYVFSRVTMTDMLLTLWITCAMGVLAYDPAFERRFSWVLFGAATGAAILTKAAAGLVPLIAFAGTFALLPAKLRPRPRAIISALGATAAVALPWHLYELVVHPRWFVAEYILTQHLSVGVTAPPQYTNENHLAFYARRLFLMDPVLALLAALSVPLVVRNRRAHPFLAAWLVVTLAVLFGFRYRSAYYLLPLLPVLALMAAEFIAAFPRMRGAVLAALIACAVIKTVSAAPVWGIDAGRESHRPIAPSLDRYCAKHRGNDLIIVGQEDQFYASDLPLPRVRYCIFAPQPAPGAPLDFAWLGISVSAAEFDHLDALRPVFRQRLTEFNLPSDAPVGTVIRAASLGEVAGLIEKHPGSDFWIPAEMLRGLNLQIPQQIELSGAGGVFLLARQSSVHEPARACRF